MSAPKHTPGPWQVGHESVSKWSAGDVFAADGTNICAVCACPEEMFKPHEIADAHLIAAAPDMLAMLKTVDANFMRMGYAENSLARESVLAVIAKAEGRA